MYVNIGDIFIMVDSCAFHPPVDIEKAAMDELWKLEEEKKINKLEIGEATEEEMKKAPPQFQNRVNSRICAGVELTSLQERQRKREIADVLFPGKTKTQLTSGDKRDIQNIFVASQWHYYFFVTYDKRHIVSKAEIIMGRFRLRVVTPSQCLKEIKKIISVEEIPPELA